MTNSEQGLILRLKEGMYGIDYKMFGRIPVTPFIADDAAAFCRQLVVEAEGLQLKPSDVVIVWSDFFWNTKYEWLPFSLAMHLLIHCTEAQIVFVGTHPVIYSANLDARRPMNCIRNFATYLNVKDDTRSKRLFWYDGQKYINLQDELASGPNGFSRYYNSYLCQCRHGRGFWDKFGNCFVTHPFDHLPVKNTNMLLNEYHTVKQWKAKKKMPKADAVPVVAHPQIALVQTELYFSPEDVVDIVK